MSMVQMSHCLLNVIFVTAEDNDSSSVLCFLNGKTLLHPEYSNVQNINDASSLSRCMGPKLYYVCILTFI